VHGSNYCDFFNVLTSLLLKASLLRYDTVLIGFVTDVSVKLVAHLFWVVWGRGGGAGGGEEEENEEEEEEQEKPIYVKVLQRTFFFYRNRLCRSTEDAYWVHW
jgi:hypothetical protein